MKAASSVIPISRIEFRELFSVFPYDFMTSGDRIKRISNSEYTFKNKTF